VELCLEVEGMPELELDFISIRRNADTDQ